MINKIKNNETVEIIVEDIDLMNEYRYNQFIYSGLYVILDKFISGKMKYSKLLNLNKFLIEYENSVSRCIKLEKKIIHETIPKDVYDYCLENKIVYDIDQKAGKVRINFVKCPMAQQKCSL